MEELQFEPTDLELVAIDENGLFDSFAVEVRAVERTDIAGAIYAVEIGEFDMASRDRDVIQEDVAVWVAAGADRVGVQGIARSRFRALVHDQDPGPLIETVAIGEVLFIGPIWVNGLDHGNCSGRVVGSTGNSFATGRAVVRGWIVEMSAG